MPMSSVNVTIWTLWPSGLRRWLKAPFLKGVGSNPRGAILCCRSSPALLGDIEDSRRQLSRSPSVLAPCISSEAPERGIHGDPREEDLSRPLQLGQIVAAYGAIDMARKSGSRRWGVIRSQAAARRHPAVRRHTAARRHPADRRHPATMQPLTARRRIAVRRQHAARRHVPL
jgi:hypothetical protein